MLSIIIPTLNEEKLLPRLLKSIRSQSYKDYEIIVADAGSKDKTIQIAKKNGCIVSPGGTPAKGRNEGVKAAKGDIVLFLDADTFLPKDFLKNAMNEIKRRKLGVASFRLVPITKSKVIKRNFDLLYNYPIVAFQRLLPYGAMGIIVKKDIFKKVGGFGEDIVLAEDHYFVRQAAKLGKFGIMLSTKLYVSPRRFQKDGYLKTAFKYFMCNLYMFSGKPLKKQILKYDYEHLKKNKTL